jgi:Family of unknown function (DUF6925)
MKELILEHLRNHRSSWSLGAFGALGEFTRDEDEIQLVAPGDRLAIATSRGGMRVDNLDQCSVIAYEISRKHRDRWGQTLAFCLPEEYAKMEGRRGITELGPDEASILDAHRGDILFDLGLATPYVNVCVRTSVPSLIAALRSAEGSNILAPGCSVFSEVLQHSPHRIFISRVGRLEVYQPIGLEKSPEGPHTHVLPKLLATGLHHAANIPIPSGMISGLMLYPGNPCVDILGREQTFEPLLHQAFQETLLEHGLPEYLEEKARILDSYSQEVDVENYPEPASRLSRLAARIALRQTFHTQGDCQRLNEWRTRFDRPETKLAES